jgi:hypothetical protein
MNSTTLITGNTYPVKDQLRALGGVWSKAGSGWLVPAANAEQARAIVAGAPRSAPRKASRYQSNYYRFAGGGEAYRNKAGRCEDAPCCGCCTF